MASLLRRMGTALRNHDRATRFAEEGQADPQRAAALDRLLPLLRQLTPDQLADVERLVGQAVEKAKAFAEDNGLAGDAGQVYSAGALGQRGGPGPASFAWPQEGRNNFAESREVEKVERHYERFGEQFRRTGTSKKDFVEAFRLANRSRRVSAAEFLKAGR